MKQLVVLFICVIGFRAAHAGLYFEPYYGQETGSYVGTATIMSVPVATDSSTSGTVFGAKIGFSFSGFGFGFDASNSTLTQEESGVKNDLEPRQSGIFFQYTPEFPIKFCFTYINDSVSRDETLESIGLSDRAKGSGFKIGVGYLVFKYLALNVDYLSVNFNSADDPAVKRFDVYRNATMLSISLPMGHNREE